MTKKNRKKFKFNLLNQNGRAVTTTQHSSYQGGFKGNERYVSDFEFQPTQLRLTLQAYLKMKYYVEAAKDPSGRSIEISGIARADLNPNNDNEIVIDDFIIFEQTGSAAHTAISDEDQAKFINELMKRGEDPSKWCVWWHSHGNLDSFFSGTDTNTIAMHDTQPILISLVTNMRGKNVARLDYWVEHKHPFPFKLHGHYDLNVVIDYGQDEELRAVIQKEVSEKLNAGRQAMGFNDGEARTRRSGNAIDDDWEAHQQEEQEYAPADEEYEDEVIDDVAARIGRPLDEEGYDQDGFDVDGFNRHGLYRADKDLMKS